MNHYTHFTLKEREILKHFIDLGKNQTEISIERRSVPETIDVSKINSLHIHIDLDYLAFFLVYN